MLESKVLSINRVSILGPNDISLIDSVLSTHSFMQIIYSSHLKYAITNICISKSCIEPLCLECIFMHICMQE
jgi:hypothetical protein